MHKLTDVLSADRYGPEIPYEEALRLPVPLPNIVDPKRPLFIYRFECSCGQLGTWQSNGVAATTQWVDHINSSDVVKEEEKRDEIVRLADQLGAKLGLTGLDWIRGLAELDAAHPSLTATEPACPDCGQPDGHAHEPTCFYYVRPAAE